MMIKQTRVIFRADHDGAWITAVFPDESWNRAETLTTCYTHMGQHGGCDRGWYQTTRPATPEEYAPLLRELCQIGYTDLKVCRRWAR